MNARQTIAPRTRLSFGSRFRRAILHFLWRTWAGILLLILLLLVGLTAYQMWRGGLFLALSLLPQLVTNLILIAAVLAVRHVLHLWQSGAIREAMLASLEQGQTVLKDKVEEARSALASLTGEVRENLGMLVDPESARGGSATPVAARCPSCGRSTRTGARFCDACGAALSATCPKCGRPLRPQARFCDACGVPLASKR